MIYSWDSATETDWIAPLFVNCEFLGNSAGDRGGVLGQSFSNARFVNCRFVGNTAPGPDGEWGTLDDDYGDQGLHGDSWCIDAGDNTHVPPDDADIDGDGDTVESTPLDLNDTARFEDACATPDTGLPDGIHALVDIGPCEFALFCTGDVVCDGIVDVVDLLAVFGAWGAPGGPEDVNGDGFVDVLDLLVLLGAWGPCE